ncbi:unnamed protein product, partial [Owenia fusiformis]
RGQKKQCWRCKSELHKAHECPNKITYAKRDTRQPSAPPVTHTAAKAVPEASDDPHPTISQNDDKTTSSAQAESLRNNDDDKSTISQYDQAGNSNNITVPPKLLHEDEADSQVIESVSPNFVDAPQDLPKPNETTKTQTKSPVQNIASKYFSGKLRTPPTPPVREVMKKKKDNSPSQIEERDILD